MPAAAAVRSGRHSFSKLLRQLALAAGCLPCKPACVSAPSGGITLAGLLAAPPFIAASLDSPLSTAGSAPNGGAVPVACGLGCEGGGASNRGITRRKGPKGEAEGFCACWEAERGRRSEAAVGPPAGGSAATPTREAGGTRNSCGLLLFLPSPSPALPLIPASSAISEGASSSMLPSTFPSACVCSSSFLSSLLPTSWPVDCISSTSLISSSHSSFCASPPSPPDCVPLPSCEP